MKLSSIILSCLLLVFITPLCFASTTAHSTIKVGCIYNDTNGVPIAGTWVLLGDLTWYSGWTIQCDSLQYVSSEFVS